MPKKQNFDGKIVKRMVTHEGYLHAFDKNDRDCFDNEAAERVILNEDLRRWHQGCHAGLLGWTVPGTTDGYKWVTVNFDAGQSIQVRTYQLSRVPPEKAAEMAAKVVAANRGTAGDANAAAAYEHKLARWRREYAKTVNFDSVLELGDGADELYAFTFSSLRRIAELEQRTTYPMKVGYTTREKLNSVARIAGMVNERAAFPERVELMMVWRTANGRGLEAAIHKRLKAEGRHIENAVGREWFLTNIDELRTLCESTHPLAPDELSPERPSIAEPIDIDGAPVVRITPPRRNS